MKKIIHIILSLAFVLILNNAWSQKYDYRHADFTNGKELLKLKKYALAMQAFKPLTSEFEDNPYEKMASFYYAVAAYHDNQPVVARSMFQQILQKHPGWKKSDEVNLWLANIYMESGDYFKGLDYALKIKDKKIAESAEGLKGKYLNYLDYNQLDSLYKAHPSDRSIAVSLADKIAELPMSAQDRFLLESIVIEHKLDKSKYRIVEHLESEKKDKYQVAVMLPFMFDEIKSNPKHLSNEFVIELYEGLLIGAADLKNSGIDISLHLYDTKKDSVTTKSLTMLEELKFMDLIIGPLFPGPVKVISDFAFKNQMNMINPLSSNSKIIGSNPFAFLFMPSRETKARVTADYLADRFVNKNAFVFYGKSERDSVLAYSYKQEIESKGFNVCHIEGIAKEDAKSILDILTNTVTVEFDASEFDSLLVDDTMEGNLRITEKDYLVLQPDSIGHVFIASNDPSLVANTITGLETRGDTIALIGSERWLDQRVISIGGLDRLDTYLIAPTFVNKKNQKYDKLKSIYMESFNSYPQRYFYIGYEVIMTIGKLMNSSGNLFQFDRGINDFIPGEIFQGLTFGANNCNQIVPIVKFINSEPVVVNQDY